MFTIVIDILIGECTCLNADFILSNRIDYCNSHVMFAINWHTLDLWWKYILWEIVCRIDIKLPAMNMHSISNNCYQNESGRRRLYEQKQNCVFKIHKLYSYLLIQFQGISVYTYFLFSLHELQDPQSISKMISMAKFYCICSKFIVSNKIIREILSKSR